MTAHKIEFLFGVAIKPKYFKSKIKINFNYKDHLKQKPQLWGYFKKILLLQMELN